MIVDDNSANLGLLAELLEQENFEVLAARSGESGLEKARFARPDLILHDAVLPGIDGFEACRRLKADERSRDIPVIFMTVLNDTGHKIQAFQVGAVDYITKPVEKEELLARVRTHLRLRRLSENLEQQVEERTRELMAANRTLQQEIAVRQRAEEHLQAILDNTTAVIYLKDTQGRFVLVNRQFEKTFGLRQEEVLGKTDYDFMPAAFADKYRANDLAIFQGGQPILFEESAPQDDGVHTVISSKFPVYDADGRPYGVCGISTDITARKQAEEEIRRLNAELEERVRLRTVELETANKELKEFAYIVSHDLKAPLRGITQLAHWIGEDYADVIDEQGRKTLGLLRGRVKRMDSLINGILEYSRIGRMHEKPESIDLQHMLMEIIDSLAPPDTIHISLDERLPVIAAEKIRLSQVFQNLLSNAIKFMDNAEGEIQIRCVDEDSFWRFSVTDTGPGIDPKYHERIFQIFQTLQTRDTQESSGIGLTLVKKIVEHYGGRVWLDSKPGQGTTFFFTYPKHPKDYA